MSRPLVFFDLETAGLEPEAEIIQISAQAVTWPCLEDLDEPFNVKIKFDETRAHPKALEINHYSAKVWEREAIPMGTALTQLSMWLCKYASIEMTSKGGRPYKLTQMAGYNSENFDSERLQRAFKTYGIFYPAHYRTLDVLQLVAWDALIEGLMAPSLKLTDVCERFNLSTENAHDALADVRMTIEVARTLLSY